VAGPTNLGLKGAQLRLRAMQSQLDAAFNYCCTAQNALAVLGRMMDARTAIEKARHTAELVRVHVNQPNRVPADSVAGVKDRLAELGGRISRVETRLAELGNKRRDGEPKNLPKPFSPNICSSH
jgi:hypothetical protein